MTQKRIDPQNSADRAQTIYPRGVWGGEGVCRWGGYGPGALPSHVHDALLNGNDLQPCGVSEIDWDENRSLIPKSQVFDRIILCHEIVLSPVSKSGPPPHGRRPIRGDPEPGAPTVGITSSGQRPIEPLCHLDGIMQEALLW